MIHWTERGLTRAQAFERSEDQTGNLTQNATLGDVIAARLGRRGFLKGALAVSALSVLASPARSS